MPASEQPRRLEIVSRSAVAERVRARAPRNAFLAFLAIASVIGLREIAWPEHAPPPPKAPEVKVDHAAEGFAVGFARAYLSYDAANPGARERALRPFLPEDLDLDAGFAAGSGSRKVVWAQVVQNQDALAGGRVIVVAAQTDSSSRPLYLAVPVERTPGGELRLTAYPSFVGQPAIARAGLPERQEVEQPALVSVAKRVVVNFLGGESANLEADLLPGARVSLPSTSLRVRAVDEVVWAAGAESGAVLVTVEAADGRGGVYTLTYELGITERHGRAYVSFVETVPTST